MRTLSTKKNVRLCVRESERGGRTTDRQTDRVFYCVLEIVKFDNNSKKNEILGLALQTTSYLTYCKLELSSAIH